MAIMGVTKQVHILIIDLYTNYWHSHTRTGHITDVTSTVIQVIVPGTWKIYTMARVVVCIICMQTTVRVLLSDMTEKSLFFSIL